MQDEMLTVDELCAWLKISRKTSERLRKEGLPFIQIGNGIRFEKEVVLQWLKDHNREGQKN
jgi:excisionase family DNA binding protein